MMFFRILFVHGFYPEVVYYHPYIVNCRMDSCVFCTSNS